MKKTTKSPSVTASHGTREEGSAAPVEKIDIEKLYRQHKTHLLRFVQRYVNNTEDAEDVVQMTFMEAMRCADRFSGLSKPSTWLFGIALNLARMQVRRNCSSKFEEVDDMFMEELLDEHSDPAMIMELREVAAKIDALLNSLSPSIRNTFEAVLGDEASYEKAAEDLNIPIGTVRSRVSRIRAAVRTECLA
jgi:RNA polymerase sigma factor (sigma-70 family)